MINLIPPQAKVALSHEYILRVASVYAFVLSGVFFAGALLTFPEHVLVGAQLTAARSADNSVERDRASFETASGEIRRAQTVLTQLGKTDTLSPMTPIVDEIVSRTLPGITLRAIQVGRKKEGFSEITVQGVADTRNTLATYRDALEDSERFASAQVPISDLARDTELPFTVTLTLPKPSP